MGRGRKPLPTRLKILKGTRKGRINRHEPRLPAAAGGPDERPTELSPEAAAEWDRVAALLASAGVLTHGDRAALELYCRAYADVREADRQLVEHGHVVELPSGGGAPSPWVGIRHKQAMLMARLAAELGLTPVSRSRVKVEAEPEDRLEKFLRGA